MGTTTAPSMQYTRSLIVDEIPPTFQYQGGPNQQQSLCQIISNAMVRRL